MSGFGLGALVEEVKVRTAYLLIRRPHFFEKCPCSQCFIYSAACVCWWWWWPDGSAAQAAASGSRASLQDDEEVDDPFPHPTLSNENV